MTQNDTRSQFTAKLMRPAQPAGELPWAFVILPKSASDKLPRRGRTTVEGILNAQPFQAMLEPDGQLSHWLRLSQALLSATGLQSGDMVTLDIWAIEQEPEPDAPSDLREALAAAPEARSIWEETTVLARLDWIHWVCSAKQAKTRAKRIKDACSMLASGKRRVCCFDPSGFYSKALSAPKSVV
ncbi:MAG: YdeI/OmpD-associated family protein [Reinekea forsetii]|jgi:hypothetical protein|nr:YdeI/OmpD-associated family protein [Reinekea forsetii]